MEATLPHNNTGMIYVNLINRLKIHIINTCIARKCNIVIHFKDVIIVSPTLPCAFTTYDSPFIHIKFLFRHILEHSSMYNKVL